MNKGQTTVVSTVLITGIILSLVTVTYIWGRPLIEKNSDNAKIDSVIGTLKQINQAVTNVADTGSPSELKVSLDAEEKIFLNSDGEIVFETTTSVPLVTTTDWGPVSYIELPYTNEQYYVLTTTANTSAVQHCNGAYGNVYLGNTTLTLQNGTSFPFNVSVYNLTTEYDYACIVNSRESFTCSSRCGGTDTVINTLGTNFNVFFINTSGQRVSLTGRQVLNTGELGTEDPEGIIIAKATAGKDKYTVTFKLVYRPLQDPNTGNTNQVILSCDNNCLAGAGEHTILLTSTEQPQGTFSTNEYNINFRII